MQREQITGEYVRKITGLMRRFLDGCDDESDENENDSD